MSRNWARALYISVEYLISVHKCRIKKFRAELKKKNLTLLLQKIIFLYIIIIVGRVAQSV